MKKLPIALFVLEVCGIFSGPCFGEDVSDHAYLYAAAGNDVVVYLDKNSVTETGSSVTAWTVLVYQTPNQLKSIGLVSHFISQDTYDCARKASAVKYIIYYDSSGDVLTTYKANPYTSSDPVVPDSIGESVLKMACGGWKVYAPDAGIKDIGSVIKVAHIVLAPPRSKPRR